MKKPNYRKILKITGYALLGLFVLLLLLVTLVPYFFKDDIKTVIDEQIAKNVNADVNIDLDKFSLSIFRNFPNITASLDDLSIIGREEFAGDTLIAIDRTHVTLDIWSLIFGAETKVRGFYLKNPRIYAKVLKSGKANWNIAIEAPKDTTETKTDTTTTEFEVSIKFWQIENGRIIYDDASLESYLKIENLQHKGRGNFNQDVFDLAIQTAMQELTYRQSGLTYLSKKQIDSDITLNINLPESKYTFKDNQIKINDFSFGFEGFVQLLADKINLDIRFLTKEDKFKNILSLVPGMFTEQFADLKTSGSLKMQGFLKGETDYEGNQLPAFQLGLQVKEGMFQYPALPKSVNQVNMDLLIVNKKGVLNNTFIHLKQLSLNFGKDPVSAQAKIEGLESPFIDALANAKINLSELTQVFPMEGMTLKGDYTLNLKAKGRITPTTIPAIDAKMLLRDGFFKTNQYPDALEQLRIDAAVQNTSGKIEDTQIRLNQLKMVLDKEPFEIKALFSDLNDLRFDVLAKGGIDLAKVLHLYPIEGMEMSGKLRADLQSKGRASYAINGEYTKIPTSGTVSLSNFNYTSTDLAQPLKITEATAKFSPQVLTLEKMKGFIGKSDIKANGTLTNYISYLFSTDAVLKGLLDFRSNRFYANEWTSTTETPSSNTSTATESKTESTAPPPSSNLGESYVVEIPKNLDFRVSAEVKETIYGKLSIKDLAGVVIIKEGKFRMEKITFKTLGGAFTTALLYDPTDLLKPKYAFNLGIKSLPIGNVLSYNAGESAGALAQKLTGDLTSLIDISGNLSSSLTPLLDESLNGTLSINILRGMAKDLPILDRVSSLTNLKSLKAIALNDVLIKGIIKDGKVNYQPFDIKTADLNMNISGSNSLEGALDFLAKLTIPKEKVGGLVATALQTLGAGTDPQGNLLINLKIDGNYLKPDISLLSANGKPSVIQEKKEEVEEKKEEIKSEIKENINERAEEILAAARKQADAIKAQARTQAQKIKEEADATEKRTIEEAAKQGVIARKAAEVAAKKAKETAYRKADQLVAEADKRAEQVMKEAQERADKLK